MRVFYYHIIVSKFIVIYPKDQNILPFIWVLTYFILACILDYTIDKDINSLKLKLRRLKRSCLNYFDIYKCTYEKKLIYNESKSYSNHD